MADDPLQEDLRPGRATELGGPLGKRLSGETAEGASAAKRPVRENGDAALFRERQDALGRLGLVGRVVDLEEVDGFFPENALELGIGARRVVRDSEVSNAALRSPLSERGQVRVHVEQVVDLHQVDALRVEEALRALHLLDARRLSPCPDLRRDKERLLNAELRGEIPEDALRPPIHRR